MSLVLPNETNLQTAPSQSEDAKCICDLEMLLERCMGDAALAVNLLKRFEIRLPKVAADIERTLADRNWTEATKLAHSLKGEAGSLAANRLHHTAGDLETSLRTTQQDIDGRAQSLRLAADQCLKHLPTILESLSPLIDAN
jgi:HPt (histidine-containing phosphotransfer) domain-containing protein